MSSRLIPPKVGSIISMAPDHRVRVVGVQFHVEDVDVGKALEQDALPSMTGLEAWAPMSPSPSTAGAVGDDP